MEPILDLPALRRAVAAGAAVDHRFFWGHRAPKHGGLSNTCFSQWWPCRFVVDGQPYQSAEQYMMAQKARLFGDEEIRARILDTPDPGRAKALGRKVRGFDDARWIAARFDLVTRGNVAKFGQDPRLGQFLLATGEELLVEASPLDAIWGIGLAADHAHAHDPARWPGLNPLGFALVRTRAILRGELPPP